MDTEYKEDPAQLKEGAQHGAFMGDFQRPDFNINRTERLGVHNRLITGTSAVGTPCDQL